MDYSISWLSDIFLTHQLKQLPLPLPLHLPYTSSSSSSSSSLMGNSTSHPNHGDDLDQFDGVETLGYRVLGVQPNSPASRAGLVSFFDFLVGANGKMLMGSGEELEDGEEYDDIDFPGLLKENKGKSVELLVWNIKCQEQRFVELSPSDTWGGAGLLGVTIRLDNYGGADERLIRVLDAQDNSPASIAGLVPLKDYLLGTTVTAFGSTPDLAAVLHSHVDKVVEIYVYNSDSDVVRVVALMPTYSWGGKGLLGAEVGTGYLHRLPRSSRSTLGQSVERKVRWVGGNSNNNNNNNNAAAPHDGGGDTNANHENEDQPLEIEPHLEMEVEQERRRRPEEATKQPHQLGKEDDIIQIQIQIQQQQQQHNMTPTKIERKPDPDGMKPDPDGMKPNNKSGDGMTTPNESDADPGQSNTMIEPVEQSASPSPMEPEVATIVVATGDSTKGSSSSLPVQTTTSAPQQQQQQQPAWEASSSSSPPKAHKHPHILPHYGRIINSYDNTIHTLGTSGSDWARPAPAVRTISDARTKADASVDEAESLFQKSPPLFGVNPSFMPPPPKMHL